MQYFVSSYRYDYRTWLDQFINDIKQFYEVHYNHIDVDSIDKRILECILQLYEQLNVFDNSHINLNLNVIQHPVCTLRVIKKGDRESLMIKCTLNNNLDMLKLYRFPNLTRCPRCIAFKNVLEEFLSDNYL